MRRGGRQGRLYADRAAESLRGSALPRAEHVRRGDPICQAVRKLVNAAAFYRVDHLLMGGDLAGKELVPVIADGSRWRATFRGARFELETESEAAEFERAWPLYMAQVTIEARSAACGAGVCDLFLFPALDPAGPEGYPGSAAVFAMKPRSRGSVRLTAPDPRAPRPLITSTRPCRSIALIDAIAKAPSSAPAPPAASSVP